MPIADVFKVRSEALGRQIEGLMEFLTTPAGPFETIDKAARRFREANVRTLESLKLRW